MVIWIFECDDITQPECWQRNLFGARKSWPTGVRSGDLCLLYNYTRGGEHRIYGVYRAVSNGARNIVPEAWEGHFPYQVRITLGSKERLSVPRFNIQKFITDPEMGRVRNRIYGNPAQEVLQFYTHTFTRDQQAGDEMSRLEDDFRRRHPREFHCSDGHDVRSLSEQAIDEWLASHQVYHEYERLSNVPERLVPDFTVYALDSRPIFIEFWGMLDDPAYQARRLRKCEAYERHHARVIELYRDDLKNIDFVLRSKLKQVGVSVAK